MLCIAIHISVGIGIAKSVVCMQLARLAFVYSHICGSMASICNSLSHDIIDLKCKIQVWIGSYVAICINNMKRPFKSNSEKLNITHKQNNTFHKIIESKFILTY